MRGSAWLIQPMLHIHARQFLVMSTMVPVHTRRIMLLHLAHPLLETFRMSGTVTAVYVQYSCSRERAIQALLQNYSFIAMNGTLGRATLRTAEHHEPFNSNWYASTRSDMVFRRSFAWTGWLNTLGNLG
jgi:hypothetical protein